VRYVTHTGERPMGITWKLETLIPAAVREVRGASGGVIRRGRATS